MTRTRLINAVEVYNKVDELCTGCDSHNGVKCTCCYVEDCLSIIDRAPTIDAVPVVRCKDCKHSKEFVGYTRVEDGTFHKVPVCSKLHHFITDNHFCALGERKDGAE